MDLFDAVLATLFYSRHDGSQDVTGVVFGVSQPTISRMGQHSGGTDCGGAGW
jgi:hypothetical protein